MWRPGTPEILIILLVIILLFGPGRISKAAKELGASITAFKEGLNGDKFLSEEKSEKAEKADENTEKSSDSSHQQKPE